MRLQTLPIIIETSTLINGINDVPIEWEPTIFTDNGFVKRNVPSIQFCGFKWNGALTSDTLIFDNNSYKQIKLNVKL